MLSKRSRDKVNDLGRKMVYLDKLIRTAEHRGDQTTADRLAQVREDIATQRTVLMQERVEVQ